MRGDGKYKMKLQCKGKGFGGFTPYRQLPTSSGGKKCSTSTVNIDTLPSVRNKSEISEPNVNLTKSEGLINSDTESDLIGAGCGWDLANQRRFYKKNKKGVGKGRKGGKKKGRPKTKTKKSKKKAHRGRKGKAKKHRLLKDIFAQYKI